MTYRFARTSCLLTFMSLFVMTAQGCFATVEQFAATEPQPREGNVVLVRGLMDIFSLGLYDIEEDLKTEGVNAKSVSGLRWPDVSKTIRAEYEQGTIEGPLVIVGHSYGADDAVRLARDLNRYNITVDFLALIDPTTPPKIPTNVQRCFNLYKSHPATDWMPFLRGVAVVGENESVRITNYDINDHNEDGRFGQQNHFDIEEDPAVQQVIVQEVLRVCPANAQFVGETAGSREPGTSAQAGSTGSGQDGYANVHPN